MHCLHHEGNLSKASLYLIVPTTSMDLLDIEFTSIEMTMELNRLPKVVNILMFQDHFMKHLMAYMTPDQTAKSVTMFLYKGYISIFGALVRLLSDHGVNFISNIIGEMYKLLGMKKLQTTPYHPQMNGLIERSNQTIMWMNWEVGRGWKANWPSHLAEIVHAYNATWVCSDWVQPTLFEILVQAKAPSWYLFPHLKEHRGAQARHLHLACWGICRHCLRLLESCFSRGPSSVYGRGSETEAVLWLENWCHSFETW